MRHVRWMGLALAMAAVGCTGPKGQGVVEKRNSVENMRQSTLQELYARRPEAKAKVETSAGYGVFSNFGGNYLFVGAGGGHGVVVNNRTGEKTYMRTASGSGGLGLGVRDFRRVIVFNDSEALRKFVEHGWDVGAEGGASAKLGATGGDVGLAGSFSQPVEVYDFTESGIIANVGLGGAKYWKDDKLTSD